MAIIQYVRVPLDRIGVLIGHNGIVKEELERASASRIKVNSEDGEVCIESTGGDEDDPTKTLRVVDAISAIGRGFSPETLTGVKISVYGKTVSLIGYPEQIKVAREAIEMLIKGTPHNTVYAFLERKRRALEPEW